MPSRHGTAVSVEPHKRATRRRPKTDGTPFDVCVCVQAHRRSYLPRCLCAIDKKFCRDNFLWVIVEVRVFKGRDGRPHGPEFQDSSVSVHSGSWRAPNVLPPPVFQRPGTTSALFPDDEDPSTTRGGSRDSQSGSRPVSTGWVRFGLKDWARGGSGVEGVMATVGGPCLRLYGSDDPSRSTPGAGTVAMGRAPESHDSPPSTFFMESPGGPRSVSGVESTRRFPAPLPVL